MSDLNTFSTVLCWVACAIVGIPTIAIVVGCIVGEIKEWQKKKSLAAPKNKK